MRADRLVAIVLLLQARGGMSAPALARELEVSTRTIYRDVEALGAAGVPVYAERGAGGGVRLLDGYRTDLTGLSPGEAEALFLMGVPGPLDELGLADTVDAARRKLLAALAPAPRAGAERIRERVHVDAAGWEVDPPRSVWLTTIARAVWSDRRLALRYVRADNQEVERRVDPLGLVLKAGQWYLAALVGDYDVTFRVSRVRHAEVLDRPARRPDGFDLAAWWTARVRELEDERRTASMRARVRVAPDGLDRLPRFLGEDVRSVVLDAVADGDGWSEVVLTFDDLDDARTRLLGLGRSVVVVDPPELRAELLRVAAGVAELYSGPT